MSARLKEDVAETCHCFQLGDDILADAVYWIKKIFAVSSTKGVWGHRHVLCFAIIRSCIAHDTWISVDNLTEKFLIKFTFSRYCNYITELLPQAKINFHDFSMYIGYVRQIGIMDDVSTVLCKHLFTILKFDCDVTPKYSVGVAIYYTLFYKCFVYCTRRGHVRSECVCKIDRNIVDAICEITSLGTTRLCELIKKNHSKIKYLQVHENVFKKRF